jgi:hypothetical protein
MTVTDREILPSSPCRAFERRPALRRSSYPRRASLLLRAGLLPAVAAIAILACASIAVPAPGATGYSWSKQTVPAGTSGLYSISAADSSHVWAVGSAGLVLRYDGKAWAAEAKKTSNMLLSVSALDASHVWAAGKGGTILFYNGSSWATQVSGTTQDLSGISAADASHVWAVATNGTVLFYNGSAWTSQTTGFSAWLTNVFALDATHVYAVGLGGDVLFGNGSSWVRGSGSTKNLYAVAAADSRHLWVGGDGVTGSGGSISFYDGSFWVSQMYHANSTISGITAVDATHAWATESGGDILFFNGSAWTTQATVGSTLQSVSAADSAHIWAAGGETILAATGSGPTPTPATTHNFEPWVCIQNPGSAAAAVKLTYMKSDGSTVTDSVTVGANSRSTISPRAKVGDGVDFSTLVSSTNGKTIIAERPMYFNYSGAWTDGHDVIGAAAPGTVFYFAEGTCRPNFDPYICIQDPGAADAAVRITYMKGGGTTSTQTLTVKASSRSTVRVKDVLGEGDDAAHDFSAKVECTNSRQIIAERPMYFNYAGKWTGGHDVIGAAAPGSVFYFAEGTCRPSFDPYICIQNPGADEARVAITYMKGNGTTDTQNLTVAAQSRFTVKVKDRLGEGDDPAHDFSAKVECTNGKAIIAERPMYFNYQGYTRLNWTGGHDVIGAAAPGSVFYFAEGTCRPSFDPYICVQNPGATDAKVSVTYMKGNGATDVQNIVVAKHSRYTIKVKDALGEGDDTAHDFSAKVACTSGQEIIAERPMYFNYQGYTRLNWTGGHDVVGAAEPALNFYFAEGTTR